MEDQMADLDLSLLAPLAASLGFLVGSPRRHFAILDRKVENGGTSLCPGVTGIVHRDTGRTWPTWRPC